MWIIMYTFCAGIYRFFAPFPSPSLSLSLSIFSVGSLPPQCKQHEVRDGCDKSAEDPDAEGLRKAAADATGAFAAATTQRGSGREPKKMSRTRAEAAEQEGGAAPPSPNRRTAKALRANAAEGAAADVVATSAQLAVTNARLEAELVRLKEQLREAEAEIQNLGGVRRSSLSAESMRTDREAEKEAKFDVSFLSTFNLDLSAERQQLSRGVQLTLFGPRWRMVPPAPRAAPWTCIGCGTPRARCTRCRATSSGCAS